MPYLPAPTTFVVPGLLRALLCPFRASIYLSLFFNKLIKKTHGVKIILTIGLYYYCSQQRGFNL